MYPNEQPQQPAPNQAPPAQGYAQPTQPQSFAQAQQQAPQPQSQPNTATFIADDKVLELIQITHPQLASAMINIAIKKFSEDPDFLRYFVKDEFKESFENYILKEKNIMDKVESATKEPMAQKEQSTTNEQTQPAMDFTSW
jgi:hypothetical protein